MIRPQVFVGKNRPAPSRLNPIQNVQNSSKPNSGFWTSPIRDSGFSAFEAFSDGSLVRNGTTAWLLKPDETQNVLEVNTVEKLEELPSTSDEFRYNSTTYIDFEGVFSNGHDGLKIGGDVAHIKSFSGEYNLRGWDFDSILWENLSWVDKIEVLGNGEERRENAEW